MVTTEIGQISRECNKWRSALRSQKEELSQLNLNLEKIASPLHNKDFLQEVEHFHNQFHIQLINIHDLRHSIRDQERIAEWEMNNKNNQVSDATLSAHEDLFEQYQQLSETLDQLRNDFKHFSDSLR